MWAQDRYGPRFFVPYGIFPATYDYYRPVLTADHSSHSSSSGRSAVTAESRSTYLSSNDSSHSRSSRSTSGSSGSDDDPEHGSDSGRDTGSGKKECAICFNDINANIRRSYMVRLFIKHAFVIFPLTV